ncbi:MAG: hypothetical protein JWQ80_3296 [Massilia sp.]|nr:hypothetical protein [Massilia sp.]
MRALPCLALISAFASTALAAAPISRGDAAELKLDIAGQYRLENGRDVRLTVMDERLYLDLNRSYRKELLPVGDKVLASRDGRLTVQYMPDGPVERILIQNPELPASVRLGERSWRHR